MDESFERRTLAKVAWRLIPFLVVLYFFAFLDRVNVGFAALTMNADLGLSATAYGFGAGIFFLGYVLFEVPSNLALERFGARVWIARIMISWGVLAAAMAFVQGTTSFYLVRVLLGIAEAGFFPGIIYYLGCWFPARERARITALFLIAVPLSSVIGAPISTALLSLDAFGFAGWRWMFLLEGIPTVLLGFSVLALLPSRPADARWLSPEERAWLQGACADAGAKHGHVGEVRRALLDPGVWRHGLVYFGLVVGLYGFGFWLPQILATLGTRTPFEVGLVTMVPYTCACIAMVLCGRHSDRTGERVWHVAVPAMLGAAALYASSLHDAPGFALAMLTLAAMGIYAGVPAFWAHASHGLRGPAAAGAIALINSIGNVGGFVGPLLVGYARQRTGGYSASLLLIAVALLGASLLVLGARRTQPGPEKSA